MNKDQIQAIANTMRFLMSKEFRFPYHVRDLIAACTAELKKLEDAGVDTEMRQAVYNIFNQEIDKYL